MREAAYSHYACRLFPLLDGEAFTLKTVGEATINDRRAVGVRVSSKGHSDLVMYFDKESYLLVKTDAKGIDEDRQEVTVEEILSDYKEVRGAKIPFKKVVFVNGRKHLEAEIKEIRPLGKIDSSVFGQP